MEKKIGEVFNHAIYLTTEPGKPEEVSDFHAAVLLSKFKSLQNNLINELQSPTAILELRPSKAFRHHEPKYLYENPETPCQLICKYYETSPEHGSRACLCAEQDKIAADLFRGLSQTDYIEEIRRKIAKDCGLINADFPRAYDKEKARRVTRRGYLEYECRMTGYREVAFPIFVHSEILGVLFIGRMRTEESVKCEGDLRKRFCSEHVSEINGAPDSFEAEFLDGNIDKRLGKETLTDAQYAESINKTIDALEVLERGIENTARSHRKKYINTLVKKEIDEFYKLYSPYAVITGVSEATIELFWSAVTQSMQRLVECLKLKSLVVLSDKENMSPVFTQGNVGSKKNETGYPLD